MRCRFATDECMTIKPPLQSVIADPTHTVACYHSDEVLRVRQKELAS